MAKDELFNYFGPGYAPIVRQTAENVNSVIGGTLTCGGNTGAQRCQSYLFCGTPREDFNGDWGYCNFRTDNTPVTVVLDQPTSLAKVLHYHSVNNWMTFACFYNGQELFKETHESGAGANANKRFVHDYGGVTIDKFQLQVFGATWFSYSRFLLFKRVANYFVKQNGKLLYWDGETNKWVELGTQEKMIRLNTTTGSNFAINLGDISISYTDYTLDFWIWISNLSYSTLFSAGTGKSTNNFFNCCQIRNGQIEFTQVCAGFGTTPDVSAPIHTGWNRITLVVQTNPASQVIYVDGVLSGSGSARSKSYGNMSWIAPLNASNAWGIANWQNGDYSKCHIYLLTTYKRALTTEEINSTQFPTAQDTIWSDVYKQWVSSDRTSTGLPEKKAGDTAFTIASDTYTTSLKDKPPFLQ